MRSHRGWYSRGYLPHIDQPHLTQFVTYRLGDAVPTSVLEQWRRELKHETREERRKELARRVERYCDEGHGSCALRDPRIGRIVHESILFDHGRRYDLHAWSVMPNHVHVLLTPYEGTNLETIFRVQKSVSATKANRILGKKGGFWQPDIFDRYMRDADHFGRVAKYIEWNPVKAGLCSDPAVWPWSSRNGDAWARLEQLEADRRAR